MDRGPAEIKFWASSLPIMSSISIILDSSVTSCSGSGRSGKMQSLPLMKWATLVSSLDSSLEDNLDDCAEPILGDTLA